MNEREMKERALAELLMDACEENGCGRTVSFRESGALTGDAGFELRLPDGRTFEVTVVEV